MAYETKDNSGALFKNERKANERQPDYTGDAVINGQKMRISAWVKKAKSGKTFMSLAFSEPQERQPGDEPRGAASHAGLDDEVPFAPER